jgi:hypothetical protein
MARKPSKPKTKAAPQFDCEPVDDDEPMPFVMDENGDMVLRRNAGTPNKEPKRGKGKGGKPRG